MWLCFELGSGFHKSLGEMPDVLYRLWIVNGRVARGCNGSCWPREAGRHLVLGQQIDQLLLLAQKFLAQAEVAESGLA